MTIHSITCTTGEYHDPDTAQLRVAVTRLPLSSGATTYHPVTAADAGALRTRQWAANRRYWVLSYEHPAPEGAIMSELGLERAQQLDLPEAGDVLYMARLERRCGGTWVEC